MESVSWILVLFQQQLFDTLISSVGLTPEILAGDGLGHRGLLLVRFAPKGG
jgi:hypothetical protein